MAAPARPEPVSGQPGGTPVPSAAELASRTIPPTSGQPGHPTDPPAPGASVLPPPAAPAGGPTREQQMIAAQEAALRDMHRQNAELTQRMREFDGRIKRVEAPPVSPADMNERFWKDPVGVIHEVITQELKTTVAPLNEFVSRTRSETAYDRMKAGLKEQYKDIWSRIEPSIDEFVRGAAEKGTEVNEQLLNIAALTATGALYRGLLPDSPAPAAPSAPAPAALAAGTPPPPSAGTAVVTPPHLRPSAPAAPGHEAPRTETRPLTENERRLARARNQTDEEYLAWLDVKPEDVVRSRIGIPEKKT